MQRCSSRLTNGFHLKLQRLCSGKSFLFIYMCIENEFFFGQLFFQLTLRPCLWASDPVSTWETKNPVPCSRPPRMLKPRLGPWRHVSPGGGSVPWIGLTRRTVRTREDLLLRLPDSVSELIVEPVNCDVL